MLHCEIAVIGLWKGSAHVHISICSKNYIVFPLPYHIADVNDLGIGEIRAISWYLWINWTWFCANHTNLFFLTQQSGDSCTLIAVGVWRFLINFDHLLIDYFRESKLVLHLILQTQSLKDQNLFSASSQHIIARFTWLWTVEPSSAFQEGVCGHVWPSALHEQLLRYRFSFSSFFFLFKCLLSCANIIKQKQNLFLH